MVMFCARSELKRGKHANILIWFQIIPLTSFLIKPIFDVKDGS